ncbi:MAG: hypothetical protein ACK5MY_02710 [Jhaorihella sp.]
MNTPTLDQLERLARLWIGDDGIPANWRAIMAAQAADNRAQKRVTLA